VKKKEKSKESRNATSSTSDDTTLAGEWKEGSVKKSESPSGQKSELVVTVMKAKPKKNKESLGSQSEADREKKSKKSSC